jgi:hypothetical protein
MTLYLQLEAGVPTDFGLKIAVKTGQGLKALFIAIF